MIPPGNVTISEYSGLKISCLEIVTNAATGYKGSNEDACDSEIKGHVTSASWADLHFNSVRSSCEVGYSMICSGQRELLRYEQ